MPIIYTSSFTFTQLFRSTVATRMTIAGTTKQQHMSFQPVQIPRPHTKKEQEPILIKEAPGNAPKLSPYLHGD